MPKTIEQPETAAQLEPLVGQHCLDFDAIRLEVEAGYISEQRHPTAPLRILNYTQRAQFDWRWNSQTMQCRGLIVDDENRVVARPFAKFFSYEQLAGVVPQESFEAYEKLDGSLGVLYRYEGEPRIASRGSFASDQATKATEIYRRKYSDVILDDRMTYLFEILYPENRIVVNYGDLRDVILLAVIETETGIEQPLPDIGLPIVKRYDGILDFAELLAQQDGTREGFVVRFASGQRVKIKFDEYKRLHKLLTGVNAKHIWEALRSGDDLGQLVDRVPDEYFAWVRNTETELRRQFADIESRARCQYDAAPAFATRRDAAMHFQRCEYPSVMFSMLDGKQYAEGIWRMVRPNGQSAFRCDGDA